MLSEKQIEEQVHKYYWGDNYNCATTVLKTLSFSWNLELDPQVIASAIGMHGAGKYGAQCGLVEGTLMFIGIYGVHQGLEHNDIITWCRQFAQEFEAHFSSLKCCDLRPGGFQKTDLPHQCESLTVKALAFIVKYIQENIQTKSL